MKKSLFEKSEIYLLDFICRINEIDGILSDEIISESVSIIASKLYIKNLKCSNSFLNNFIKEMLGSTRFFLMARK